MGVWEEKETPPPPPMPHMEICMNPSCPEAVVVEGKSVQVMYDYQRKQSMPLSEKIRDAMVTLEKLQLEDLASP